MADGGKVRGAGGSLSARRAWIEICRISGVCGPQPVALRKESVDRNMGVGTTRDRRGVALRKESVDRNIPVRFASFLWFLVALRKESVDRNNG